MAPYRITQHTNNWWVWADSNCRPHPYQGCALPTELYQHILERAVGIEPTSSAWKAEVIAIIRCPHPGTRLPDFSVEFWDGAGLFITRLASFGPAAPCAAQLEPCRRLSPSPPAINRCGIYRISVNRRRQDLVVGEGFEPSKSVTADLQSAPFGRSGTPPDFNYL